MWRGSYPCSDELMGHADAHGMLMWVENRFLRYIVQPLLNANGKATVGNPECQPLAGNICANAADQATCTKYYVPCSVGNCNCAWSGSVCYESPDACSPGTPASDLADPQLLKDINDMVLRDRNHPSVVIWSLCNEVSRDFSSSASSSLAISFFQCRL